MMKCPVCSTIDLLMTERHGIEVDYCPTCRGVWLDRGELDKIIERAAPAPDTVEHQHHRHQPIYLEDADEIRHEHDGYSYRESREHGKGYRKKKSLLGEIFDF